MSPHKDEEEEEEEKEEEEEEEEEEERHFNDICPGKEPEKCKTLSQMSRVRNVNFLHDENTFITVTKISFTFNYFFFE